jgi:peptidyl-tRNA hydrolase, PTH1 family
MKLLVGLGNPGAKYTYNRHNIGFMVLEEIARHNQATPWKERFSGAFCEATLQSEKVLLLKPLTYMNDSGRAVQACAKFYKLDENDVVVFHDELDLEPAKLRIKKGGGNAGHNGLRSITAHIGNEYTRVRLGIGHPGDKALVHNYVLNDFDKAEQPWVKTLCRSSAQNIDLLIASQEASFANKVHLALGDLF